ncbi:helix-turn-helix domain-containing protein [Serratia symbiotica]|uniref:Helix-turn-helix domain-containing protein n=1 Tax=Serratia symbiotica SCt-VLC TaxID=1347341 RepID=A0A068RFH0_9GAMM|nr:helix-turn-helix domain-containing protein [Serratia symbiotica]CDG48937.1 Helix-turn-helix domain-containing protein [Serratia symbiotica SCt-VLC]
MSSKLHGLVWEGCAHAGLILSRVAVMARLADYSNNEGLSWPAVETIQREIGAKSTTTVSTAITELERDGWLVKTERKAGGRNLSNLYQIEVEKLEAAAEAARAYYKTAKKRASRTIPPNIDPSKNDGSTVDKNEGVNPPMIDPDPSLTTDPSDNDFSSRHPDAVVYSARKRQWGSHEDLTCAQWIWGRIAKLYDQAAEADGEVVRPKEPNWTAWANEICLMCFQDGRTHKQICELFRRANRDPFWCKNILSPSKLREKWDDLSLKLSAVAAQQKSVVGGHWNSPEAWENTL